MGGGPGPLGPAHSDGYVCVALILSLCVMFCFCTLLLTFAKAMILRLVGVVMPGDQVQMPLLQGDGTGQLMETYPF